MHGRPRALELVRHLGAFRHSLIGGPPVRIALTVVRRQLGPEAVRAQFREYPPANVDWLKEYLSHWRPARFSKLSGDSECGRQARRVRVSVGWPPTIYMSTWVGHLLFGGFAM